METIRNFTIGVAVALLASCAEAPAPPPVPPISAEPPPIATPVAAPAPDPKPQSLQVVAAARLPMLFEPNRGQATPSVRFLARGPGQAVFLGDRTAAFAVALPPVGERARGRSAQPADPEFLVLTVEFAGAQNTARAAGRDAQPMVVNHAVGRDRARWLTGLPGYNAVRYEGLYPGIDAEFRPDAPGLAYDFEVAPGADPTAIRLRFPGVDSLALDANGDLLIRVAGREIRQRAPRLFQDGREGKRAVEGGYTMRGRDEVGLRVGAYDRGRPLIVDPILDVSTVFGGGDQEILSSKGFSLSAAGEVAATGFTLSADFPALGAGAGVRRGQSDMFVAKFAADTLAPVFLTLIGGNGREQGGDTAFAPDGRIYAVGDTTSTDLPVTSDAPYTRLLGLQTGMVARLDATGVPDYVTYLHEDGYAYPDSVATFGPYVYIGGTTYSESFATQPLVAGLPPPERSNGDAFIVRLRHDTGALDFARYFGGAGDDRIVAMTIGANGQLHVVGATQSPDLPGASNSYRGGLDGFVLKLNPAATESVYLRYLGGGAYDRPFGISVDADGAAHVAGQSLSIDFPTVAPFQPMLSIPTGFYVRLSAQGDIEQSGFVGGSPGSLASSAARQPQSSLVWIGGRASTPPPIPPANPSGGGEDAFVASLDPAAAALRSWTFVGGSRDDLIYRIFPFADGSMIVAGTTYSPDFPATRALRNGIAGSQDVFVARLVPVPLAPDLRVLLQDSRDPVAPGAVFDFQVTVVNDGPGAAAGVAVELTLPPGLAPVLPLPSGWTLAGATLRYALGALDANRASPPLLLPVRCVAPGAHTTSARVAASAPDRDPTNDRRDETTACGAPNLLVSVDAVDFVSGQPPSRRLFDGGPVRVRLTVRNIGQGPAADVTVTNTRPAGCAPLTPQTTEAFLQPTLAAGATASFTVSMRCPAGVHRNAVVVAAANEGPAEAADGNAASATFEVQARPRMTLLLDHAPNEKRVGRFVRFAPVVRNSGTVPAEDVRVLLDFTGEGRAVLTQIIALQGSVCSASSFAQPRVRIECRMGTLAPGETRYVVRLDGEGRNPGAIRLTVAAEAQDGRGVSSVRNFPILP